MNKLRITFLTFLILSLVLMVGCAEGTGEPEPPTEISPEVNAEAEARAQDESSAEEEADPIYITFEGTDLDGNTLSQEVFSQSKLTMVNVWATYCNPCLNEMPGLGELAAEHDSSQFQIIGIISDVWEGENQELAESLIQQTGANYPHLLVNDSIYYEILTSVTAVPTTFFFDGDGAFLGGIVGSTEKSAWEELISGLLEEL